MCCKKAKGERADEEDHTTGGQRTAASHSLQAGGLFNLAVEHNITNHLLAADVDMTREDYNKMRGNSVREINSTRGTISLKDVIQEDNY